MARLGGVNPRGETGPGRTAIYQGLRRLVRNWEFVPQRATRVREPMVPSLERPEAFIEWGVASNFGDTFRQDASIAFTSPPLPKTPLHGTFTEEGRVWEDFEVVNPDDPNIKIILRRTVELALTADYRTKPPGKKFSDLFGVKRDQARFSFSNAGEGQPPSYVSSTGAEITPIVFSPLEQIKEIQWGGRYIIISALTKDMGSSLQGFLQLLEPPTMEVTFDSGGDPLFPASEGVLKELVSDGFQRDNEGGTKGDKTKHHDGGPAVNPGDTTIAEYHWDGNIYPIADAGNVVCVFIGEGHPEIGWNMGAAIEYVRSLRPDKPSAEIDPWIWVANTVGNCIIRDLSHHFPDRACPGGESAAFFNNWHTNRVKAFFVMRKNLPWDEKYYQPYAFWAAAIDMTKMFALYGAYMATSQKPVRVAVHLAAGEPDEDATPSAKVRWALYKGRMDVTDPPSVAETIGEGPYNPDLTDRPPPSEGGGDAG